MYIKFSMVCASWPQYLANTQASLFREQACRMDPSFGRQVEKAICYVAITGDVPNSQWRCHRRGVALGAGGWHGVWWWLHIELPQAVQPPWRCHQQADKQTSAESSEYINSFRLVFVSFVFFLIVISLECEGVWIIVFDTLRLSENWACFKTWSGIWVGCVFCCCFFFYSLRHNHWYMFFNVIITNCLSIFD